MPYQMSNNDHENTSMNFIPRGRQRLPEFFQPGCYDVICARGKKAYQHEGTQRFRGLVKLHQESYGETTCKYEKSKIVSHIVNTIRECSQVGGFVKLIDGVWYEVGDRAAKEKVGQTFRDLLHNKYSSSTKAKARVRIKRRVDEYNASSDLPQVISFSQPQQDVECHATIVSHNTEEQTVCMAPNDLEAQQRALTGPFFDNIETFDYCLPTDTDAMHSKRASLSMPPLTSGGDDRLLGAELIFDCASLGGDMDDFFCLGM